MKQPFTFRQISDAEELEQLLSLRFNLYAKSRMKSFICHNKFGLDFDKFDLHAHHFGLFLGDTVIGYIRIIENVNRFKSKIAALVNKKYGFVQEVSPEQNETGDFPFLSYSGVPQAVKEYYNIQKYNTTFLEGSRLIISEEYRSLKAVKYLLDCSVAASMDIIREENGIVILDCAKSHEKWYSTMGFTKLPDIEAYNLDNIPVTVLKLPLSVELSNTTLPKEKHNYYTSLYNEYQYHHQIQI